MHQAEAIKLIASTFGSAFDRSRFESFIRELLKSFEPKPFAGGRARTGKYIYEPYRDLVESFERIGKFEDVDKKTIELLIVRLKPGQKIDRARTKQRNFIAYYLEHGRDDGSSRDAALVAFIESDSCSWRFSLVRMEYELIRSESGKIKSEKTLSPARRFSFLVGEGENTHTAQARFVPILSNDSERPTLEIINRAFSVESITDEFFESYRELFHKLCESLEAVCKKDSIVREEFKEKGIEIADFAKKLLGQIVFLYFLQRKGWLGVQERKKWGTGPRNFLRCLFDKEIIEYKNFFNDALEYLFYDMLAVDKGEASWHEKFNCRIPFLNGGLFEPLFDYDWRKTHILIPNEVFSNRRVETDFESGSGILDIFDRYNFTVREDEPLEKEVAIDPELLGKVFENLLEVRSRKNKGTYYTPREVVHYMCQQSLISYLSKHLDALVPKHDIEQFIIHGDIYVVHDARVIREGRETPTYRYTGPEAVRVHAVVIDQLLAQIKVCDPAVGSGAFPLGLLNEIVRARHNLNPVLYDGELEAEGRDFYSLKWHSIENSIYGVDIDPGAIEIAKLRLWLSLIVDEESLKKIKPLPNLDFKLMQGNSLVDEFEGIQLIDPSSLKKGVHSEKRKEQLNKEISELQREYFQLLSKGNGLDSSRKELLEEAVKKRTTELKSLMKTVPNPNAQTRIDRSTDLLQANIEKLKRMHQQFFGASLQSEKKSLKERILQLEWEVMESAAMVSQNKDAIIKLRSLRKANTRPFFLWHLHFTEVFAESDGFDVIIANPPYGADIANDLPVLEKKFRDVIKNYADIYKMFFQLGIELLHTNGVLTLITPNTFVSQPRYKDLRTWLLNYNLEKVVNLGEEIFKQVVVPVCISIISKGAAQPSFSFASLTSDSDIETDLNSIKFSSVSLHEVHQSKDKSFHAPANLKSGEYLAGDILHLKDAGIQYHRSGIGLKNKGGNDLYERLFSSSPKKFKNSISVWYGKLIESYYISPTTDEYFNLDYKSCLREKESASFTKSAFETRPKIIWRQTAPYIRATLDLEGRWFRNTIQCCWIKEEWADKILIEWVLGVFNSSYFRFLYNKIVREAGRVFPQVKLTHIRKLPIRIPEKDIQNKVKVLVQRLIAKIEASREASGEIRNVDEVKKLLLEIDEIIFRVYEVDDSELTATKDFVLVNKIFL